jgi:hypothetical protein
MKISLGNMKIEFGLALFEVILFLIIKIEILLEKWKQIKKGKG